MGQSRVLHSHTSSQRDSWWYLVQDDDGALFIEYENDDAPNEKWKLPINDFLKKEGTATGAGAALRKLVDRMFEDNNAKRP